jgi:hypothetical protein
VAPLKRIPRAACGAGYSLQWGHASSRVETNRAYAQRRVNLRASMGPRVFTRGNKLRSKRARTRHSLQWGHASSRVETIARALRSSAICGASMGPRVFTRGNAVTAKAEGVTDQCFNGATRLHAWKRAHWIAHLKKLKGLQWGHASSRVETFELRCKRRHRLQASMGRRVFTRGNSAHCNPMLQ